MEQGKKSERSMKKKQRRRWKKREKTREDVNKGKIVISLS